MRFDQLLRLSPVSLQIRARRQSSVTIHRKFLLLLPYLLLLVIPAGKTSKEKITSPRTRSPFLQNCHHDLTPAENEMLTPPDERSSSDQMQAETHIASNSPVFLTPTG